MRPSAASGKPAMKPDDTNRSTDSWTGWEDCLARTPDDTHDAILDFLADAPPLPSSPLACARIAECIMVVATRRAAIHGWYWVEAFCLPRLPESLAAAMRKAWADRLVAVSHDRNAGEIAACGQMLVALLAAVEVSASDAWLAGAIERGAAWPLRALLDARPRAARRLAASLLPRVLAAVPLPSDRLDDHLGSRYFDLPGWLDTLQRAGTRIRTRATGRAVEAWLAGITLRSAAVRACPREGLELIRRLLCARDALGRRLAPGWGWRWLECGGPCLDPCSLGSLLFQQQLWEVFGPALDWKARDFAGTTRFSRLLSTAPRYAGSVKKVMGEWCQEPGLFVWRQCGVWVLSRLGVSLPWMARDACGRLPSDLPYKSLRWEEVAFMSVATDATRATVEQGGFPPSACALAASGLLGFGTAPGGDITAALMASSWRHRINSAIVDIRRIMGTGPWSFLALALQDAPPVARREIEVYLSDLQDPGARMAEAALDAEEAGTPLDQAMLLDQSALFAPDEEAQDEPVIDMPVPDTAGPEEPSAAGVPCVALYTSAGVASMASNFQDGDDDEARALRRRITEGVGKQGGALRPLAGIASLRATLPSLRADFPHFEKPCRFIEDFIVLSEHAEGVFWLPPMLLVGPPAIGKTFFLKRLAEAVGTDFHSLDMASVTAGFHLTGSTRTWRGSRPGWVFNKVFDGSRHANPILLLDELDKVTRDGVAPVEPVLLGLLEPGTAGHFVDEYIELPLDLRKVVWTASANDLRAIADPLRTRMHVFELDTPSPEQRAAMVGCIWRVLRTEHAWGQHLSDRVSPEVVAALVAVQDQARDCRKVLLHAAARALSAGRAELAAPDISGWMSSRRGKMGFLT